MQGGWRGKKWTLGVSIPLPPACEAGALPSELNALNKTCAHHKTNTTKTRTTHEQHTHIQHEQHTHIQHEQHTHTHTHTHNTHHSPRHNFTHTPHASRL